VPGRVSANPIPASNEPWKDPAGLVGAVLGRDPEPWLWELPGRELLLRRWVAVAPPLGGLCNDRSVPGTKAVRARRESDQGKKYTGK